MKDEVDKEKFIEAYNKVMDNKETLVEEEFNSVNDCINKYPDLKAS